MAEDVLIDTRLAEGQRLVQDMIRGGVAVVVAGWVMSPERGWTLYISATYPDPNGWGDAFRVLHSCYMGFDQPTFGLSEVRLVRTKDAVTSELLRVRSRGRDGRIARARVEQIDDRPARMVYVYPPVGPMTPRQVLRAVVDGMIGRGAAEDLTAKGEVVPTVTVRLRDGRILKRHPVGISAWGTDPHDVIADPMVSLRDPVTAHTSSVPLSDIIEVM